jgi:hypothetical protein
MPSFENAFIESRASGQPVIYNGFELIRMDRIPVKEKFSGTLRIISTNSELKQAAVLRSPSGKLSIDSSEFVRKKGWLIWEDECIGEVIPFEGVAKDLQLCVYNAWQQFALANVPFTNYWTHGAAMIVEIEGNKRTYRCNDGHPDENFDDIVFEVIINE